jgi:hypothetical protein
MSPSRYFCRHPAAANPLDPCTQIRRPGSQIDSRSLSQISRSCQSCPRYSGRRKQQKMLDVAAFKELRSRLIQVFNGCYDAVYSEMEALPEEAATRKHRIPRKPRRICQLFLKLPRNDVCIMLSVQSLFTDSASSSSRTTMCL